MDPFVHLHTHTEYSILDGAAKLDNLIEAAIEDGQPAISSTDHGNMYGAFEFYKRCKKAGIKYIPGQEFYMAKDSRDDRPKRGKKVDDLGGENEQGEKLYYHITMLAETDEGFHNMIKLSSKAFLEGYYYKPRIDWEMLEEFHTGIIATSGCLGGLVLQACLNGDIALAKERAGRLQTIFGKENFFIELQDHGLVEQIKTNPMLLDIAKYIGAPLLVTNDSHYVHQKDALAHDALLCVQTGSMIADTDRFKFSGTDHYLKSSAEMRYLFRELPTACDNTLWIAERSNVIMDSPGYKLPLFPFPEEYPDDSTYLRELVYKGAETRWPVITDEIRARLDFELDVVKNMGFSSYFLILWDIVKFAHDNLIATGPGRGSAAGSAVSYCLRITELDPIKYDLLFERFLNPSRISMPDIDLDIDSRFRERLIRYTAEKYGQDRVAQIITFNSIKARAAVRDASRVLGHNYGMGDRVAKAMPPVVMGRDTPLFACLKETKGHEEGYAAASEIRDMYKHEEATREVIDVALGLEGLRRGEGIHAAAVVIADKPLVEYLPICRKGDDKPIVTQYEMNNVEELGLLKIDFLGLKNIDFIDVAYRLILAKGEHIDLNDLPLDDFNTFKLLQAGQTLGVFQLEGGPMRELLRKLAPTEFEDIAALVALYRPGPMASNMHNDYCERKNGRQYIEYFHEDAKPILEYTYGLMIYQEQMIRIAQKFAGYSVAEADNLRKACGKKIREIMAKEKDKFIAGVIREGYGEELAHYIWDMIEPFADYSFNKSHAYAYGFIAFQTAYLKANYPLEYMTALLSCSVGDSQRIAMHMAEARRLGLEVLLPSIVHSDFSFKPFSDTQIIFGLDAVKNVNEGVAMEVINERTLRPFSSFVDFIERMTLNGTNKKSLDNFVLGGACDGFRYTRKAMQEAIAGIQKSVRKKMKDAEKGVSTLFDLESVEVAELPEFDPKERLAAEKVALGVYISDHPLNNIMDVFNQEDISSIAETMENPTYNAQIVGMIVDVKLLKTRKGEAMSLFYLEDISHKIECVLFPRQHKSASHLIKEGNIVKIGGRIDVRDEHGKFIVQTMTQVQ